MDKAKAEQAGARLAAAIDSDVIFYNGEVSRSACQKFVSLLQGRARRASVLLILVTPGGDPDAAFKIGRLLQTKYATQVSVFIPGWCKSAGTLIALAASHLFIGDNGELGPLDIQIAKSDELLELGSGLTVDAAMKTLEATAAKMFINLLYSIRRDTQGMITTRTASELASNMTAKLLDPIYRQIDPMKIGENSRAMNITSQYGRRLANVSGILKNPRSLEYLVSSYPDHGFVIDRREATGLFTSVKEPSTEMSVVAEALGDAGLVPQSRPAQDASIMFLCPEPTLRSAQRSSANVSPGSPAASPRRARTARGRRNGSAGTTSGEGPI